MVPASQDPSKRWPLQNGSSIIRYRRRRPSFIPAATSSRGTIPSAPLAERHLEFRELPFNTPHDKARHAGAFAVSSAEKHLLSLTAWSTQTKLLLCKTPAERFMIYYTPSSTPKGPQSYYRFHPLPPSPTLAERLPHAPALSTTLFPLHSRCTLPTSFNCLCDRDCLCLASAATPFPTHWKSSPLSSCIR